jgi:hypothetical protein
MTRFAAGTSRGDKKDADTYFSIVAKIGIQLGTIYSSSGNEEQQNKPVAQLYIKS